MEQKQKKKMFQSWDRRISKRQKNLDKSFKHKPMFLLIILYALIIMTPIMIINNDGKISIFFTQIVPKQTIK